MTSVVVNPNIQLTWVGQHWSDEEKISARQIIVDMVCHSNFSDTLWTDAVQMEDYKKRIPETSAAPPPPQQAVAQSHLLTSHFNLLTLATTQQVSGVQTIGQELSTYLTTEIAADTDPLAFWHVSRVGTSFERLRCPPRSLIPPFQPCSKSRWTIYLFKHPRFLANGSSSPALKQ